MSLTDSSESLSSNDSETLSGLFEQIEEKADSVSSSEDAEEDIEKIVKEELEAENKEENQSWFNLNYFGVYINMPSFFCVALIFYAITALIRNTLCSEGELLVRKPPLPRPFFGPNTSVNDYYNGNFGRAYDMYNKADLSVTFFYAPWSLHSKEAKREYVRLGQLLNNTNLSVKLNAVNCDTGFCRHLFKVHNYPAILAVATGGIPVFYEEVPVADKIFNWILHMFRPMHRLNQIDDKKYNDNRYDMITVAYLTVNANHPLFREFKVFRAAALKSPNSRIGFFYTTDLEIAEKFGLKENGLFKIGNKLYRIGAETTSQAVLETINKHYKEIEGSLVANWRTELKESEGLMSTQLFDLVNKSKTAVVFFTSMHGEFGTSENLESLRKIAFEYYQCDKNETTVEEDPADVNINFNVFDEKCVLKQNLIDKCCKELKEYDACGKRKEESDEYSTKEDENGRKLGEYYGKNCKNLQFLKKKSLQNHCCKSSKDQLKLPQDVVFECYSKKSQKLGTTEDLPTKKLGDIKGIRGNGCQVNRTVQFIAAEKRFSGYFGRIWNLNGGRFGFTEDTIAVISIEQEVIKEIEFKRDLNNLLDFLENMDATTLGTLSFSEKNRQSLFTNTTDSIDLQENPISRPSVLVKLDSERFKTEILNNPNRTHSAVVFFSGGSAHGQSVAVTYILHAVKQEFVKFESLLKFYIIDTSRNSLPYAYVFDSLPSIVFFPPAKSFHLQIAHYPTGLPITVPNVLAFLISRATPELKWRLALRSCTKGCLDRNRLKLLKFDRFIRDDIRMLKLTRNKMMKNRVAAKHFSFTLKRRKLQQAAAHYLLNVLRIIQDNDDVRIEDFESVESHNLFIRYLLSNTFSHIS
ncbi:unnamed protein product [Bursaphelenchus okinawaensis]|uniref:Thioredoxin domain-containing protein n=1 Tax=Bursaphelenchus okinawaensis TaxID=465554 RepID=A0A811KAE5_9BILA|nr:unnamed protein product [Bursaphelenchus okinawaensis]CAG9097388.1 unnamed protein product [Bursaphelenchus okinawaensis]